jgi:hypothetical protein
MQPIELVLRELAETFSPSIAFEEIGERFSTLCFPWSSG